MARLTSAAVTYRGGGVAVSCGPVSDRVAVPPTQGGIAPRYLRLSTATSCHIRPGGADVVASEQDMLCQSGESLLLDISGCTHLAFISPAAASLILAPLEDG